MEVRRVPPLDQIFALAHRSGIDLVGVAGAEPFASTRTILEERKAAGLHGGMNFTYRDPARSTDPAQALSGARSLVVGARSYRRAEPAADGRARAPGRVARYSWTDHYQPLRKGLETVAETLRDLGWRARVLVDDNGLVDRAAAHRAGLGWFGKNSVLLLPGRGSWFVLGSVVTDAPLAEEPGGTVEPQPDGCGACTRCLSACPTGALVEPGVLDARRCLAWLLEAPGPFPLEHRAALGGRIYGCDECQEVCPPNRREERHRPPPACAPAEEAWVDLVEMLSLTDSEILERYGRWYVPERQARYVRRNALVALGNVGQGDDATIRACLGAALADPDPLVRSHAVWAAIRLGQADLLDDLALRETDEDVWKELLGACPTPDGTARRA